MSISAGLLVLLLATRVPLFGEDLIGVTRLIALVVTWSNALQGTGDTVAY